MLRRPKNKIKTVSEKVAELIAQTNGDESSENSADEATAPRVVDFEPEEYELPEARSTEFRKKNVKLLSEQSARYKGKIASRKDFEQDSAQDDDQEAESDEDSNEVEIEESDLAYEQSDSSEEESMALAAFNKKLKGAGVTINNAKHETNSSDEGEAADLAADDDDDDEQSDSADKESEDDDNDYSDADDDVEDNDYTDDDDDENDEELATQPTDIISKQNQQAEVQKGICVQNQLQIWERLLELRINTQKVLSKTNQLPDPGTLQTQRTQHAALDAALTTAEHSTGKLLQQLLELQSTFTQQFSELRNSLKNTHKRRASCVDDAPEPKRFATELQSHFQEFSTYRNSVLLRWDDRTKLLTPGAGAKKKSLQEDYDVLKKIENSLANRSLLVSKSQTLQTEAHAAPKDIADDSAENELANSQSGSNLKRNVNVYDDSDFYHQLLRELIEYKANTSSNMSDVTKQFVELQKLRQKMKKIVDTRASKGRRLRYVVHNKLVNFMAPDETCDWTEESKDELYKSLFV